MLRLFATASILILATAAAAKPPKDAPERSADPRDKVICKRFVETGSLVRGYRACKTKADWERERDALRQQSLTQSCAKIGQGGSCG